METTIAATAKVQHITKASSDQLLNKFAELGSSDVDSKKNSRLLKRQKRTSQTLARRESSDFTIGGVTPLVERKSLLPPPVAARRSSGAATLVRQLRVGRAHVRSRNFRNKSFIGTIEKTWRRTVDEASKIFVGKHHNRHKRLISDVA